MRYRRLFLGFVLIVAAVWVIVGEQLAGASADATVNAQVTTVRTPIAGDLALRPYALGAAISKGAPVGTVSDPHVDDTRFRDLLAEQAIARAAVTRVESELADLKREQDGLHRRLAEYQKNRTSQLVIELGFARERLDRMEAQARRAAAAPAGGVAPSAALARLAPAVDNVAPASGARRSGPTVTRAAMAPGGRDAAASGKGATTGKRPAGTNLAPAGPGAGAGVNQGGKNQRLRNGPGDPSANAIELPGFALSYARERVAVLQNALDSARQGVFLGDGYNDTPFSGQRLEAVTSDLGAREAELAATQAKLSALDRRVDIERVKMQRASSAELVSPVNGVYWDKIATDGEYLERGNPVVHVVDCDSAVVTVSVTGGVYSRLRVGSPAEFRFTNEPAVYAGSVLRLAGSGAADVYHNLAVAPSKRHLERYDVTVLVPALRNDPALRCLIGRTGRVFFDQRPLDWLRRILG